MSFIDENGVYFENYGGSSFQDSSGSQVGQNSQWNGYQTQMEYQPACNPCQYDNGTHTHIDHSNGYNTPMPPLGTPFPQEVYIPQETSLPTYQPNSYVNPPVPNLQPQFFTKKPGSKKAKRHRTAFTTNQITKLEEEYSRTRYVDRMRRMELSKVLRLTDRSIKVWFQNRRMKEKKERAESPEISVTSSYMNLT